MMCSLIWDKAWVFQMFSCHSLCFTFFTAASSCLHSLAIQVWHLCCLHAGFLSVCTLSAPMDDLESCPFAFFFIRNPVFCVLASALVLPMKENLWSSWLMGLTSSQHNTHFTAQIPSCVLYLHWARSRSVVCQHVPLSLSWCDIQPWLSFLTLVFVLIKIHTRCLFFLSPYKSTMDFVFPSIFSNFPLFCFSTFNP